jgi:hypothetical protein
VTHTAFQTSTDRFRLARIAACQTASASAASSSVAALASSESISCASAGVETDKRDRPTTMA